MPWLRTRFCMLLLYVVVAAAAEVHSVWLSNHWVDLDMNTKCYHAYEPATMPYKSPLEHLQSPHTSSTSSALPQTFTDSHSPLSASLYCPRTQLKPLFYPPLSCRCTTTSSMGNQVSVGIGRPSCTIQAYPPLPNPRLSRSRLRS